MKKRILCYGDSNTWGYQGLTGLRFDEETRWTGILQKLLGEEYTIIEEGHNGRTTVWDDPVENRMAGISYLWPCMDSQSPFDLIIIMLGTNDTKGYFHLSAQNIADGAGRLVDMAANSCFGPDQTHPKVLLVSPVQVVYHEDRSYIFDRDSERRSLGFPAAFKKVAEEKGCFFMDAAEITMPGPLDGIHLDAQGHRLLAEAFCRKIRELIG